MYVTGVLEDFNDESVFVEQRAHFFRRNQKTVGGVGGPRKGKIGRRRVTRGHLLEGEPATWLKYPANLRIKRLLVQDVHSGGLHPDSIKPVFVKVNSGKGNALKQGFAASRGSHILLLDADSQTAWLIAERLRQAIAQHQVIHDGRTIQFTISIGLSVLNASMPTPASWLVQTDNALYHSKHTGRNRVTLASPNEENVESQLSAAVLPQ